MKYHFIAIGGSAMHNLALALHDNGNEITGSDDAIFEPSKSRLNAAGLLPENLGWDASRIDESIDCVVLGMHAKADNPELIKALEMGIEVVSYPELIYKQSEQKTRVVIAGSHGKTTITSMVLHVLNYFSRSVDYLVGAQLEGFDRMVRISDDSDFMIIEGDEYLTSPLDLKPKFLWYKPNIALISGISWDHINVFKTEEEYRLQFEKFIESTVPGGSITYNYQDETLRDLVEHSTATIRKFPYILPEYEIIDGVTYLETEEGPLRLEVFGDHNLSNLEGARWICQQLGIDIFEFYEAIATFKGAAKRMQRIKSGNYEWFKDFAHAPSKVEATTSAVKKQYASRNVVAILELHTYSSLNPDFIERYLGTLSSADEAIVFYDPEALKIKGLPMIDEEKIKFSFGRDDLQIFTYPMELEIKIKDYFESDSLLLFMSSGNYGGINLKTYGG